MSSIKMRVQIEVDVADAESVTQAREMAFELARPLLNPSKKRGPKTSGPRAIVIGVSVLQNEDHPAFAVRELVPHEAME